MPKKQIVKVFKYYGGRIEESVNAFIDANPSLRIVMIVPTPISYAGGETEQGATYVFEEAE